MADLVLVGYADLPSRVSTTGSFAASSIGWTNPSRAGPCSSPSSIVDMPAWTRLAISKTIHWTLDPPEWWVTGRSSRLCLLDQVRLLRRPVNVPWSMGSGRKAWRSIRSTPSPARWTTRSMTSPWRPPPATSRCNVRIPPSRRLCTPGHWLWMDTQPRHSSDLPLQPRRRARCRLVQGAFGQSVCLPRQRRQHLHGDQRCIWPRLTRQSGPPVTYTIETEYNAKYIFDADGKLTTWSDPQGHTWTYSYDGSSQPRPGHRRHGPSLPRLRLQLSGSAGPRSPTRPVEMSPSVTTPAAT